MYESLKRLASRLSPGLQQELKRLHFARHLRKGTFVANESEFDRLGEWVASGDWVLDIGANVGHYAVRLADLVGATGRVIAFEPVPASFELLAANLARYDNVTLINAAVSDRVGLIGMTIPSLDSGLKNYYQAQVTTEARGMPVLALQVDQLNLPHRVRFAKMDVEGHEIAALRGMASLIERDRPTLVVEGRSPEVERFMTERGYRFEEVKGSPNRIFLAAR